jgi:hypothetical protein
MLLKFEVIRSYWEVLVSSSRVFLLYVGFDTPTEKYFKSHLEKLRIADIERKRNAHLERLRKSATSNKPSERVSKTTHLDDSQMNSVKSNQSNTNNNSIPMDQLTTHKSNNARKSPSLEEATEGRISKLNGRMIDPASIEEDTIQLECILNRLAEKLQPLMNEDKYVGAKDHAQYTLQIRCPN